MDADVAALPDGGRLPQGPWQKRDTGGLRRLGAQRGSRPLHREKSAATTVAMSKSSSSLQQKLQQKFFRKASK
jgi:hypothetical protein